MKALTFGIFQYLYYYTLLLNICKDYYQIIVLLKKVLKSPKYEPYKTLRQFTISSII